MKEDKLELKNKKQHKKQICIFLILLSVTLLFLTTFEFVLPVKQFLLGVFGVMLYPMLVFTLLFCSALASGRKFVYSPKYIAYLFLCFFFFMCVLHIIFTGFSGQEFTYGEYLTACFNTLYTPGGLLIGVFTYPLTNLLHAIAGVVVYAIAFVISLYFVLSYIDTKKQSKKVVTPVVNKYQTFNNIANELNDENEQELEDDEELEEEFDNKIQSIEEDDDNEDIFIKDEVDEELEEENENINLAKKRLGLIPKEEIIEEERKNKLFSNTNESWQNRGVLEKEEKPQKIVYDANQVVKPKENSMYQKNKEYLNSLYEVNLDSKNPIINAENYEDYKEKMRLYNEKNAKPFIRDFELNVNQTLHSSAKNQEVEEKPKQEKQIDRIFDTNFGIEPNRKIEGLNLNNSFNSNLNNSEIKPITREFNSYNQNNNTNNIINSSRNNLNNDIQPNFSSEIQGIDEDFINSISSFEPKVSPLNPVNFDLSQDNIVNIQKSDETSQKFIEKTETDEPTPFDSSKLSSGDISTSLGNTYNLPKSMRNFATTGNTVNVDNTCSESNSNEPNFRFEGKYIKPPIDLLETYVNGEDKATNHERNIEVLERVLEEFKIPAKVEAVRRGASVTRYELHMPTGIPVRKIHAHASDIALALAAKGEVRIETPIRGKSAVGIEVPNAKIDTVGLKDIIASNEFMNAKSPISFALGKDVDGEVYCCNLAKMPHLLVAGSTGSGKSVCLNSLLLSLIYRTSPEDLRLILVDPKRVEFGIYNDLPHLLMPKAITDPKKALNAFDWLINEMERRYTAFQECYVKDIKEYNAQPDVVSKKWQKLPYIVLVVDELADLVVTTNKKELEEKIIRLTQKARAAGIHVILATQRPSVDIITGSIKINLPARIAFAVTNFVDSKTILDQGGAEKLLGRGDMLYSPSDGEPTRVQGAFVDTPEVRRVVEFIKQNNKSTYDDRIARIINSEGGNGGGIGNTATVGASSGEEFDSLMPDALKLVIENGQASISMLQRRFSIGFSRAARIIDQMELAKFISSSDGSKPRNVFITMDDYNKIYGN